MERKLCRVCNINLARKGKLKCHRCTGDGTVYANRNGKVWRIHKKHFCECCGFVAVNPCQLDVDHIDGNKENNDPSNYQTLCANCHRLKTFLNRDNVQ